MREIAREVSLPRGAILTLEQGLYAAILLAGAALRGVNLAALPLRAAESERALRAWALWQGPPEVAWGEPLLTLTAGLSFLLFGPSDLAARLGPLLWSLGGIAACWLLRDSLGRIESLVLALLLAVSPTFVYASRLLAGDAPALTLLLVGLGLLGRAWRAAKPSPVLCLVAVAALLLLLGPPGVTATVLLTTVAFLARTLGLGPADTSSLAGKPLWYGGSLVLLGYAVVATGLFAFPEGLSPEALRRWVLLFERSSDATLWYLPLLSLALYEPLVTAVGVGATGWWFLRGFGKQGRFDPYMLPLMLLWPLALLLALLMETKEGVDLLPTVLLLSIVTAQVLGHGLGFFLRSEHQLHPYALLPAFLFLLSIFVTARVVPQTAASQPLEELTLGLWLALPLVAAGALLFWFRRAMVLSLLGLGVVVLFILSWHQGIALNLRPGPQEFFARSWPPAEARPFASLMVERARSDLSSNGAPIAVEEALRFPWAWYLRAGPPLRFFRGKPPQAQALLLGEAEPALGAAYGMMKSQAEASWVPQGFSFVRWWRWILYREPWGAQRQRWTYWYEQG